MRRSTALLCTMLLVVVAFAMATPTSFVPNVPQAAAIQRDVSGTATVQMNDPTSMTLVPAMCNGPNTMNPATLSIATTIQNDMSASSGNKTADNANIVVNRPFQDDVGQNTYPDGSNGASALSSADVSSNPAISMEALTQLNLPTSASPATSSSFFGSSMDVSGCRT